MYIPVRKKIFFQLLVCLICSSILLIFEKIAFSRVFYYLFFEPHNCSSCGPPPVPPPVSSSRSSFFLLIPSSYTSFTPQFTLIYSSIYTHLLLNLLLNLQSSASYIAPQIVCLFKIHGYLFLFLWQL